MKIKKLMMIPALVLMLTQSGCFNPKLNKDNAELLVTDFLEDFRAGNYDAMYDLTHDGYTYFNGIYNPDSASNAAMFRAFGSHLEYEIKDIAIDGKECDVTVHITNVDADKALTKVTATYLTLCDQDTNDELDKNDLLTQTTDYIFNADDAEKIEHDTVFNLIEKDKEWTIESNIMIYDDITGGYMTYVYKNVVFDDLLTEMATKAAEAQQ